MYGSLIADCDYYVKREGCPYGSPLRGRGALRYVLREGMMGMPIRLSLEKAGRAYASLESSRASLWACL